MELFSEAHFYNLPSQGNVYSYVDLCMTDGTRKALFGILKRKVFSCEFSLEEGGKSAPLVREVPFTYIPAGAEIISMDAFNKSTTQDNFFVGISIIKVTPEKTTETYLNVYTEPENGDKNSLNLDSIAQNCLMLELSFTPYQLYHTYLYNHENSREVVWLLPGSDLKVHLFREDPQSHTYGETEIDSVFPEFDSLYSVILSLDIKHTSNFKMRFTAFGCECGFVKLLLVECATGNLLRQFREYYDGPVSRLGLFSFTTTNETEDLSILTGRDGQHQLETGSNVSAPMHLFVVNALRASTVFMDVESNGLRNRTDLPDSDKYDAAVTGCTADVDLNGIPEILVGTYAQMLLVYHFDGTWKLNSKRKFSHALHAIGYTDLSSDGVKELVVCTMSGIHILQHKPASVLQKFRERYETHASLVGLTATPTLQS